MNDVTKVKTADYNVGVTTVRQYFYHVCLSELHSRNNTMTWQMKQIYERLPHVFVLANIVSEMLQFLNLYRQKVGRSIIIAMKDNLTFKKN